MLALLKQTPCSLVLASVLRGLFFWLTCWGQSNKLTKDLYYCGRLLSARYSKQCTLLVSLIYSVFGSPLPQSIPLAISLLLTCNSDPGLIQGVLFSQLVESMEAISRWGNNSLVILSCAGDCSLMHTILDYFSPFSFPC